MKQNDQDTIFAPSGQFKSAIKIIRISGNKAKKIPDIFNFKAPKPRTFVLKKLTYNKTLIDTAPVVWLPKQGSFTGEDTYEIYIHGSIVIEKLIYKALSSYKNFRLAEPGEFTKRAVINGNIDLIQAESINEIINTQTEKQLKDFGDKLSGEKKKPIEDSLEDLKKSYESKDIDKIDSSLEKINEAWKAASEEMYKAQQGQAQQPAGEESQDNSNSDNVEDVDFEEVKE